MTADITQTLSSLPTPVALVLGSGLQNAAAQVGMWRALASATDWRPDFVIGASSGSLLAACVIAHPRLVQVRPPDGGLTGVPDDVVGDAAEQLWRNVADSKLTKIGWTRLAGAIAGRDRSRTTKQWRELLGETLGDAEFPPGSPHAMVATDVTRTQPSVIDTGSLVSAVLTSAAFPVITPAVEAADGNVLVDGSFIEPVPVTTALRRGARSILVCDTGRSALDDTPVAPTRWFDVVLASIHHQVAASASHDIFRVAHQCPIVVLSTPEPFEIGWPDVPERITAGQESAANQLAMIASRWTSITEPGVYCAADEVALDRRLSGVIR